MADVFLSYAHLNRARIEPLTSNLQQAGFSLWWDNHINVGSDFTLEIERELDSARCVVVAWSEAARNSLWVRAEATEALDAGKLVQIQLDGVKPPLPFTVVQMLDFRRWSGSRGDAAWSALESAARSLTGGATQAADPRTLKGPALQDFGSTAAIGWLSILLIALTAVLTLQVVNGGVSTEFYGIVSTASFVVSCIALLLTLSRVIRTAQASGRK